MNEQKPEQKPERKSEQRKQQVAAIMIPTGSDRLERIDRRRTLTISTNHPTSRRQPTTAPVRRPSVATGRAQGRGARGAGVQVRSARPVHATRPVSRATYWCRRVFVAALVVGLVLLMAQAGAALGGSSLATPERSTTSSSASSIRSTVVRPGDSLWSVASRLAPGSDPRPVVDALSEARDGAPLVPGETIEWGG